MVLQLKCGSFAWDIVFQSFAKTDLSFFPGETRTSIQPDFLPVPDIFKPFLQTVFAKTYTLPPALWPGEGERHCLTIGKAVF